MFIALIVLLIVIGPLALLAAGPLGLDALAQHGLLYPPGYDAPWASFAERGALAKAASCS